ncbi:MAG: preprotein translocase subunit SecG [Alcaligenaceae bacterium]|nr:preprotein translocase subunit SecG [Alcaligenaceae bacterium]
MEWLSPVLLAIQVISSLSIIVLVLLQQGKGADMGSSFGGGSAGSLFGATGAANFLSRTTKWAAVVFFVSTAGLAWVAHKPAGAPASVVEGGVMQNFQADPSVPVVPGAAPAVPGASVPASGAVPAQVAPSAGNGAAAPVTGSVPAK